MFKTTSRQRHNGGEYDLQADLQKIRGAISDTASDFRTKATEVLNQSIDNLKDQSTRVKDNVANYTAEKPFKSIGISLLVGLAVGLLLRR